MDQFQTISPEQAYQYWEKGSATVVDIRDPQSFQTAHVKNCYHLTSDTINEFLAKTDLDTPVMVFCYHGHSSQGAAQYLINLGFDTVYSVNGGFEQWSKLYPNAVESR